MVRPKKGLFNLLGSLNSWVKIQRGEVCEALLLGCHVAQNDVASPGAPFLCASSLCEQEACAEKLAHRT